MGVSTANSGLRAALCRKDRELSGSGIERRTARRWQSRGDQIIGTNGTQPLSRVAINNTVLTLTIEIKAQVLIAIKEAI